MKIKFVQNRYELEFPEGVEITAEIMALAREFMEEVREKQEATDHCMAVVDCNLCEKQKFCTAKNTK